MESEKKDILTVKLNYKIIATNASGVITAFINIPEQSIMYVYNTIISTPEMYEIKPKTKIINLFSKMIHANEEYSVLTDSQEKIKERMMMVLDASAINKVLDDVKKNDFGAVEYLFKRVIGEVLNEDKVDISSSNEKISRPVYDYLLSLENVTHLTYAKKLDIVKKFNDGKKELAEKVLKNNLNDIIIIKVKMDDPKFKILGIVFISTPVKKIISYDFAATKKSISNIAVRSSFVEINSMIPEIHEDSSAEIEKRVKEVLESLVVDTIISVVKAKSEEKLSTFFKAAVSGISQNVSVEASYEVAHSVLLQNIVEIKEIEADSKQDEEKPEKETTTMQTIDVSLVLSPTKGKNISSLLPGNRVNVMLDPDSPAGRKMIDRLGLMDENDKVKPLGCVVHNVKRDSKGGFTIYVKIGGNLYGKVYEEEDIKVKCGDPVVETQMKQAGKSFIIGLAAGLFVIIITVVVVIMII